MAAAFLAYTAFVYPGTSFAEGKQSQLDVGSSLSTFDSGWSPRDDQLWIKQLDCVQAVLRSQGETIFQVDSEQGTVITSFRQVEIETLRNIAETNPGGRQVHWKSGFYRLAITLTPVKDGERSQLQVNALIFGTGETSLPLMRPSNWWPLPSSGKLEGDLLAALKPCARTNP